MSHGLVKDAAVKGIYSDHNASEAPVGYITTSIKGSSQRDLLSELKNLVDGKVAHYKRITGGIYVLEEIPRKYNTSMQTFSLALLLTKITFLARQAKYCVDFYLTLRPLRPSQNLHNQSSRVVYQYILNSHLLSITC